MLSITNWLRSKKVAVCLYLYHTDLWPEFKELLLPLSKYIKLYVGLCQDNKIIHDFDDFDHKLSFHKNYGADVSPFLYQLQQVSEEIFIKLHSKKSLWGFKKHINWRQFILNDLIVSKPVFKSNLKSLISNDDFAVICNKHLLLDNREFKNSKHIQILCDILKLDYVNVKNSKFIAGNMFMAKSKIYKRYFNSLTIPIIDNLLSKEKGKIEDNYHGTFSHAMERVFGYIIKKEKLDFCYPKHKTIKILNKEAPNKKYFTLIKMYNSYCYLVEDPNVYGYYNEYENSIIWYHLDQETKQKYKAINKNTLIKI